MIRDNLPKPKGIFPEVNTVHGLGTTLNVSIDNML